MKIGLTEKILLVLMFLVLTIGIINMSSAYVYDDFTDGSINWTFWTNYTDNNNGFTTAETGGYMEARSGAGNFPNAGIRATSKLPPIQFIKSINFTWTTDNSIGGSCDGATQTGNLYFLTSLSFPVFQTQAGRGCGGLNQFVSGSWTIGASRNSPYSNNFSVWVDGSLNRSFLADDNRIEINVHANKDQGGNFMLQRLGTISYETYGVWNNQTSPLNDVAVAPSFTFVVNNTAILEQNLTNVTYYFFDTNGALYNKTSYNITGKSNITSKNFNFNTLGNYNWSVETCGTNSTYNPCYNSLNQSFTVGGFNESYSSTLLAGQIADYVLNISYPSLDTNLNAILYLNNTAYTPIKNLINSSLIQFTVSTQIPLSWGNTSGISIPHQWRYYLNDNSINDTTSILNQTVFTIGFDNCSTLSNSFINFTLKDEDTLNTLSGVAENTSAQVYLTLTNTLNSSSSYSFNATYSNVNPFRICTTSNAFSSSNFKVDLQVRYTADNYAIEYYNSQNSSLSEFPKSINLYPLLNTQAQQFQIEYRDSNFLLVPDVVVQMDRQYLGLGTFLTVEAPKTDSEGKTVGNFVLNDVVYNIYVTKDNRTLATFLNQRAFCEPTIQSCTIKLNERAGTSQVQSGNLFNGVRLESNYNLTTRIYTTTFSIPDGSSKLISLNITNYGATINNTICSTSLNANSGILTCTIPSSYLNQSAIAYLSVDGTQVSSSIFYIGDNYNFGQWKYFLAFALFLTLVGIGTGNKIAIGFSIVMGIIIAGALQLLDVGGYLSIGSTVVWLVILIILLVSKLNKGESDAN